jgi:hypothetical protein
MYKACRDQTIMLQILFGKRVFFLFKQVSFCNIEIVEGNFYRRIDQIWSTVSLGFLKLFGDRE